MEDPSLHRAESLFQDKQYAEAIKAYNDVVQRFDKTDALASQELVAKALMGKGLALSKLSPPQHNNAIEAYDDILQRFGRAEATALKEQVAKALVKKGRTLGKLSPPQYEQAITVYDDLVQRFREETVLALREQVAKALYNKGFALGELSPPHHEQEIAAYDELMQHFGGSKEPAIEELFAEALFNKGDALGELSPPQYQKQIEAYDELVQRFGSSTAPKFQAIITDALYNKALALIKLSPPHYEEAIKTLSMPSDQSTYDIATYVRHNLAYIFDRQGKYEAAHEAWNDARKAYESFRETAASAQDGDFFRYYGQILHEHFGELEHAEQIYNEGLKVAKDPLYIYIALVNLHLEQKSVNAQKRTDYHWKSFDAYHKAVALLTAKPNTLEETRSLSLLGKLHLAMGQHEEAEKCLTSAADKIKPLTTLRQYEEKYSDIFTTLGVLCTRREDYRRAADYFELSLKIDPDDFNVWSNLAEVLLRLNQAEKAEREFQNILRITPGHIDTLIGLGQVYTTMADNGDVDRYEQAVYHLTDAISFATNMQGSKRLTKTDLAAVYYSRGYAKAKLYENSKHVVADSLLIGALDDFKTCCYYDPDHYKSRRALERLTQRISYLSPQRLTEKFGTWAIIFPSICVLLFAQTSFVADWPRKSLSDAAYQILTFGSLVFIIAGLFLPQLTKFKAVGVELEKSQLDQITTSRSLGITK